jgi:hypothetical protein
VVEIPSPRFSSIEISELLQTAGAPGGFPSDKIADFLLALTGGLPVLVAAAARLLKIKNWMVNNKTLESFFGVQSEYSLWFREPEKEVLRNLESVSFPIALWESVS